MQEIVAIFFLFLFFFGWLGNLHYPVVTEILPNKWDKSSLVSELDKLVIYRHVNHLFETEEQEEVLGVLLLSLFDVRIAFLGNKAQEFFS